MLFVILRQLGIYTLNTRQQKLIEPFGLTAIICTNLTPTLIAVLVPVRNFDEDICRLADYLPVPSIFQLDRIGFFFVCLFRSTQAVLAQRI